MQEVKFNKLERFDSIQLPTDDGIVAPYGCALGLASQAVDCMLLPKTVVMLNLYSRTNYHERLNRVDPTSNLRRGRVFIYQGQEDTVVRPGNQF